MAAPAGTIFEHINNQRKWQAWSPWAKIDPAATFIYQGNEAGIGAVVSWTSNNEVGIGTSTIIDSVPNEFVKFSLDFQAPMKARHTAEFSITAEGEKILVTWTMYGENSFIAKV